MKRNQLLARLQDSGSAFPLAGGPEAARPQPGRGDHDLNPGMPRKPSLTPAAVLVPLVDHAEGMNVLLTQRTDHLYDHAGQISFPGGKVDSGDEDAVAAALRETQEEVGIPARQVEVVGQLDDYETRTGFLVTPVIGFVAPGYEVALDPFEVADVFEVPLSFILDPANHRRHRRVYEGVERHFYVLPYEGRYIWGATAGMLVNLYEVLHG